MKKICVNEEDGWQKDIYVCEKDRSQTKKISGGEGNECIRRRWM